MWTLRLMSTQDPGGPGVLRDDPPDFTGEEVWSPRVDDLLLAPILLRVVENFGVLMSLKLGKNRFLVRWQDDFSVKTVDVQCHLNHVNYSYNDT